MSIPVNSSRFAPTHDSAWNDADGLVDSILSGFIATFVLSAATFGAYGVARAFGDLTGNQFERWLYNLSHNTIINSNHPGGVNAVLADGAVRYLPTTSDFVTLKRLACRYDGQVSQ